MSDEKRVAAKPLSDAQAKEIAQGLRNAMKGMGTDEKLLIHLLAPLTSSQAHQVVQAYKTSLGRDLAKDIKDELRGNFEDLLVSLITDAPTLDAIIVKKAIAGLGTNDELLIEVMCTRDPAHIKAMVGAYRAHFGKDFVEDVKGDVSGDYGKLITALATCKHAQNPKIDDDIKRLYSAGEDKIGTNEDTFIEVLGSNTRDYTAKLDDAYGKKYGKPLKTVIKNEMGGNLAKALVTLVTPPAEFFGDLLHNAMKGVGTDESTLIRVIVSQRDERLKEICAYYIKKYEKSLSKAVESEVGGDFKKGLVAIIKAHGEI